MNLKEKIKKMQEEFSGQIPQEVSDIMQSSTETLILQITRNVLIQIKLLRYSRN